MYGENMNNLSGNRFKADLEALLNKCSIDDELDVPDHVLADYVIDSLRIIKKINDYNLTKMLNPAMETLNYE